MASPFGDSPPDAPLIHGGFPGLEGGFPDLEPSPSIEQPAAALPALRVAYTSSSPDLPAPAVEGGDCEPQLQLPGPKLAVTLQPLQLLHRPACLARVRALLAGGDGGASSGGERQQQHAASLSQRVLQAINRMQSPAARALAKAEQALQKPALPSIHVEVSILVHHSVHNLSPRHLPAYISAHAHCRSEETV